MTLVIQITAGAPRMRKKAQYSVAVVTTKPPNNHDGIRSIESSAVSGGDSARDDESIVATTITRDTSNVAEETVPDDSRRESTPVPQPRQHVQQHKQELDEQSQRQQQQQHHVDDVPTTPTAPAVLNSPLASLVKDAEEHVLPQMPHPAGLSLSDPPVAHQQAQRRRIPVLGVSGESASRLRRNNQRPQLADRHTSLAADPVQQHHLSIAEPYHRIAHHLTYSQVHDQFIIGDPAAAPVTDVGSSSDEETATDDDGLFADDEDAATHPESSLERSAADPRRVRPGPHPPIAPRPRKTLGARAALPDTWLHHNRSQTGPAAQEFMEKIDGEPMIPRRPGSPESADILLVNGAGSSQPQSGNETSDLSARRGSHGRFPLRIAENDDDDDDPEAPSRIYVNSLKSGKRGKDESAPDDTPPTLTLSQKPNTLSPKLKNKPLVAHAMTASSGLPGTGLIRRSISSLTRDALSGFNSFPKDASASSHHPAQLHFDLNGGPTTSSSTSSGINTGGSGGVHSSSGNNLVMYAMENVDRHKSGLLRKRMSIPSMLSWSRQSIKKPLILTVDKEVKKDAVEVFRRLQAYMGDRKVKAGIPLDSLALEICVKGWGKAPLRDEIYIQLCKQTTENPRPESLRRGWELLAICLTFFPPSLKFKSYLDSYIERNSDPVFDIPEVPCSHYAQHCSKKLDKIIVTGVKRGVRKPTREEIEQARLQIFHPSMFGNSLEEIMRIQQEKFPERRIPWIQETLSDMILNLRGIHTEGIFRVPGDIDEVNSLKVRMDQWLEPPTSDPHVPASLLKLWYRELATPLIPEAVYEDCLAACENPPAALSIIKHRIPPLNRSVLLYLIEFLQKFTRPSVVAETKMDAPNLAMVMAPNCLRCQSEDPCVIFENTRKEMTFIKTLLENYRKDRDGEHPDEDSNDERYPNEIAPIAAEL